MTRPHITPDKAAAQAAALGRLMEPMRDVLASAVLDHFAALVRDPRACSDLLLITADALREAADLDPWPARGATLARLATALSDLAPTRATPLDPA